MAFRLMALALAASTLVPAAVTAASAPSSTTLLEIDGSTIALSDATVPTKGEAPRFTATVLVTSDSPAVTWAIAAASGKAPPRDGSTIVVENGVARRRMDWTGGHIVDLKFSDLDKKKEKGKKPLTLDFKWEAETVEFSKASGKIAATQSKPAPRWDASSFRIDGLPGADAMLASVSLPSITIADKGRTIGDLVLVFEGDDAETLHAQVKKVIRDGKLTDGEYLDLGVTMVDPSTPDRTGKLAMPRCKLRSTTAAPKGKSGMATVTAVFNVETFDPQGIVLQHK